MIKKEKIKDYECLIQTKPKGQKEDISYEISDKESSLKIEYESQEKLVFSEDENKSRFKSKDIELIYENKDEKFKETIIFNTPLIKNTIDFKIESKGLEFYKQLPLTEDEIEEGCERPEDVINSYAVYYSNQKLNRTNKFCHIYRPYIEDAKGTQVWCDMNIQGNLLIVTIPQKFLDTAVYPITLDPTIGYATLGASSYAVNKNNVHGVKYAFMIDEVTNVNSVSIALKSYGATLPVKFGIYATASNNNLLTSLYGVSDEGQINGTPAFCTLNFSGVSIPINNWVVLAVNVGTQNYFLMYDAIGIMASVRTAPSTYPAFVDPHTNNSVINANRIYSAYITYNEGGAKPFLFVKNNFILGDN